MIALTKCIALDCAQFGIRVNAVCPAGVGAPMPERALGYCPHRDVIGDAAVFLLSDRARIITGCIPPVSSGAELGYPQ
jgi:NAD(P)-dependent dehydrogenase (short-subunit alcohol dehydrogenase family)